jgi:hypothetical protein
MECAEEGARGERAPLGGSQRFDLTPQLIGVSFQSSHQAPGVQRPSEFEHAAQSVATLLQPAVYLEAEVQSRLTRLANAKGVDFSALVNALLRKDIEFIEMAK